MTCHCENCGCVNPKTNDGYTVCCNELVCDGGYKQTFKHDGTGENVRACCWSRAEKMWEREYKHRPPNGSYRD